MLSGLKLVFLDTEFLGEKTKGSSRKKDFELLTPLGHGIRKA